MKPIPTRRVALALALVVCSSAPRLAIAQGGTPAVRSVSLEEALRLAASTSEAVRIARAGVTRASGQQYQARSQWLPQLNGTVGYTRTLKSQFQGLGGSTTPDTTTPPPPALCSPFIAPDATQAERDAALAQAISCPSSGGGFDFSKTGFGAANQWVLGLQLSQNVFTFGRIAGQNTAANASRRAAEVEVTAQNAQLALDVTQAYFDAALAERLVSIAQTSLQQTEEVLRQTRLARQVGNQSEFDLLRAQVTRDNQVPVLIQRQSDRQVAFLRLKQLLDIPLDDSLTLTTPIEQAQGPIIPAVEVNGTSLAAALPDTIVGDRAPVRQSEANVRAQEGLLRAARAERFPQIAITSGYQRLYFPTDPLPNFSEYRQNWTVGVSAAIPLFSGGRIHGDELIARANLEEAQARMQQTRELAALDTRVAYNAYQQAEAAFRASQGTAEQAERAYSIDQIRYREGLSTQTDLSQSRLLLEQAVVNRVSAARDLAIARMRLALLRDLPLQLGGSSSAASQARGGVSGGTQQQQTQPQQQRATTQSAAASAGGQLGGSSIP